MPTVSDTPRTDTQMLNGCLATTLLEHARTLERELNNTTPPATSLVWPEISRLRERIASLDMQLTESLRNQLRSEETILRLLEELELVHKRLKNYTNAIESL